MSGTIALAIGICMTSCAAAGIGIGMATGKAVEAIARQPEASKSIRSLLLLGAVLVESTAIYGMFVSFLLLAKM
ncbi:MAG: ATP synthase F0 subunit C [Bacilli bacterium]|nr:ATP synthase F0 subunit C [Bacilli bacterium]